MYIMFKGLVMAKGESGRVVLEIDSDLKRQLYAVLALEGKTLKQWFIEESSLYVEKKLREELNNIKVKKHEI